MKRIRSITLCLAMQFGVLPYSFGAEKSGDHVEIKIDDSKFAPYTRPSEMTGGFPEEIGYLAINAISRFSSFLADGRVSIDACVITHPNDYPYAVHDLFGSIRRTSNPSEFKAKGKKTGNTSHQEPAPIRFIEWKDGTGASKGTLCIVQSKSDAKISGGVYWYGTVNGKLKTVTIGYTELKGIPREIIDSVLREVPSETRKDDPALSDWESKDLKKWADLLRGPDPIGAVRDVGSEYLKRYDENAFGLFQLVWGAEDDSKVDWKNETGRIADRIEKQLRDNPPAPANGK